MLINFSCRAGVLKQHIFVCKVSFNTHALRMNLRDLHYGLYNLSQLRTNLRAGQCILSSFHRRASVLRCCQLSLQLCARSKNACNRNHCAVKKFRLKTQAIRLIDNFFFCAFFEPRRLGKSMPTTYFYIFCLVQRRSVTDLV